MSTYILRPQGPSIERRRLKQSSFAQPTGILSILAQPVPSRTESFLQCSNCKKTVFTPDFEQNFRVCPLCGFHHRLPARLRLQFTLDEGSFHELDTELHSVDPLEFPEYREKLEIARTNVGGSDSVISGVGSIDGRRISIAASDFSFMGGSMGSVAGEKVARTLERGIEQRMPTVLFCASGGARMQEGMLSLMQMAKTTAAAARASRHGIPYIAVFTDPTMAGVLASYASVADVILAEPRALVGFAGARVSRQAGVKRVPDDFQTAEWVFEHGMIDRIVHRKEMRSTLSTLIHILGSNLSSSLKG